MKRLVITLFSFFFFGGCFCSSAQKINPTFLDIDIKADFIEFSIKRIWQTDSLSLDGGRAKISEFITATQFLSNYYEDTIIKILGKPFEINNYKDSTFDYVYISDAIRDDNGIILNSGILILSFTSDSLIFHGGFYALEDNESLIKYNQKK